MWEIGREVMFECGVSHGQEKNGSGIVAVTNEVAILVGDICVAGQHLLQLTRRQAAEGCIHQIHHCGLRQNVVGSILC